MSIEGEGKPTSQEPDLPGPLEKAGKQDLTEGTVETKRGARQQAIDLAMRISQLSPHLLYGLHAFLTEKEHHQLSVVARVLLYESEHHRRAGEEGTEITHAPITVLGLPMRVQNSLLRAGMNRIWTVEASLYQPPYLKDTRGIGAGSERMVRDALERFWENALPSKAASPLPHNVTELGRTAAAPGRESP